MKRRNTNDMETRDDEGEGDVDGEQGEGEGDEGVGAERHGEEHRDECARPLDEGREEQRLLPPAARGDDRGTHEVCEKARERGDERKDQHDLPERAPRVPAHKRDLVLAPLVRSHLFHVHSFGKDEREKRKGCMSD